MGTEEWALLVAVVALMFSIGIPIWQLKSGNKQITDSKRTLLLQRILEAKSTHYLSLHELIHHIQKYGSAMHGEQRKNLEALLPKMRRELKEMETLYDEWFNYKDGENLQTIERQLSAVNLVASEANDTAKLIENGRRTYENT